MKKLLNRELCYFKVAILILAFNYTVSYSQAPNYWPIEGWRISAPEEQGLNSQKLADGINYVVKKKINLHSILIIRNGHVVMDAYMNSFEPNTKHDLASVTKSITSTIIGTAIEKGHIDSVQQKILSFYPHREIKNVDDRKRSITIEDLLTMKAGLQCTWNPFEKTFFEMINSPDWVEYILDLPMATESGKYWEYNSGSMQILSDIIRQSTGKSALKFANEALFLPLGISDVAWPYDNEGLNNYGSCCIRMLPHDLAKIGLLYLNDGVWDGKRILPEGWVQESTKRHAFLENSANGCNGFGYLWWLKHYGYSADGRGAQLLHIIPEKDLIVVTTGGTWESESYDFLKNYILPSIQSDSALPENNKAYNILQVAINKAANSKLKSMKSSKKSKLANEISGKKIILDSNPFKIEYLKLVFENDKEAFFTFGLDFDCDENCPPTFLVGLDGIARMSDGRFGLPALVSGKWKNKKTFIIKMNEISNTNVFTFKLMFNGNKMNGSIIEDKKTGLFDEIEISGKIEESK